MYIAHGKYDYAYEFATKHLPSKEIKSLYCKNAQKSEYNKNYKDAEIL